MAFIPMEHIRYMGSPSPTNFQLFHFQSSKFWLKVVIIHDN